MNEIYSNSNILSALDIVALLLTNFSLISFMIFFFFLCVLCYVCVSLLVACTDVLHYVLLGSVYGLVHV
jgi:hypothetical protein